MERTFEHKSFGERLHSMLSVDFRRMFGTRLFYIFLIICLVTPVLVLVMTTMMDGTVTVDPQTGAETVIEGFDNAWQIIGTASGDNSATGMSMTSMCNINLLYFALAVLVGLFVSGDFKCGYAKNLFTVRAGKNDYIFSKMIVCVFAGAWMLLAFFAGSMLGGAVAGLPFALPVPVGNVVLCMLAKLFLIPVFVPIFLTASVCAREKTWLAITGSLAAGMLLFMMIPLMTPLDATVMNAGMCLAGGTLFSISLGAAGKMILKKNDLV